MPKHQIGWYETHTAVFQLTLTLLETEALVCRRFSMKSQQPDGRTNVEILKMLLNVFNVIPSFHHREDILK